MKAITKKTFKVISSTIILSLFISSLTGFLFLGSCITIKNCPTCVDEEQSYNLEIPDNNDFTTSTALGADSTLVISATDM